jgi:hypothetical protein
MAVAQFAPLVIIGPAWTLSSAFSNSGSVKSQRPIQSAPFAQLLELERGSRRRDKFFLVVDRANAAEVAGGSLHSVAIAEVRRLADDFLGEVQRRVTLAG